MLLFVLRRLFLLIATLWAISLIIFSITQILPGDVSEMILGMEASKEDLVTLRRQMGLDRPAIVQYLNWIKGILTWDLGISTRFKRPVAPILIGRIGSSLWLGVTGFLIAIPIGLLFGIVAGLRPGRPIDHFLSGSTLFLTAVPEFVTGAALIVFFSTLLGWFPPFSSYETEVNIFKRVHGLFLPALSLSMVIIAYILRMMRASLIEVMQSQYVRAAFLKGLPWDTVLFRHALPIALGPTINVTAICTGWMMGGLIIVENMFGYPGLGRLFVFAIQNRDIPMIQAISILLAGVYAGANLIADVLCRLLDPRVKG